MKKNELVHLHALLTCVAEDFVDRGVVDADAFAEYRALGISSRSLRASREDHETAVRRLAETLSSAAAEDPDCGAPGDTHLSPP
ncbi:metal-binding protein [Halogeometricum pallidum JCM 14848]|uniref:Metal-binding protein n=1 Tax=Halogeometricum pallidum JCM 14848 TaxID=1227487 RepID=M0CTX9_HALPD|nr:UPF0058 family protein [Halogeometricum pallidum]ELZ26098.1 metal-binding protein [Halogeometricum pallidum JCM 14848]